MITSSLPPELKVLIASGFLLGGGLFGGGSGGAGGAGASVDSGQQNQDASTTEGSLLPNNGGTPPSEASNASYASSAQPQLGSTDWLYDYNRGGNLQGNINIGGFAVSADDGDSLYVLSDGNIYQLNDEGNVVSLVYSGTAVQGLNICDSILYFVDAGGTVHSIDLYSGQSAEFDRIDAERIYFDNGRMFFTDRLDHLNLYTVRNDGTLPTLVDDAAQTLYSNVADGVHYYCNGTDGNRIYATELSTGNVTLLYDKPAIWLSVWNGRIYFEEDTMGSLASIALDGSDFMVVYDRPCYYIVASARGIFAIDAINNELIAIDAATGEHEVLLGQKVEFCVAGNWVVYRDVRTTTILGMVRQDGSESRLFEPGV